MNIFIAGPLFNEAQIQLLQQIETLCAKHGHSFYSARIHSGSHMLSADARRDYIAWIPVFQSNVQGLYQADLCIAVLVWADAPSRSLYVCDGQNPVIPKKQVHIPDTGTVWELGFLYALGTPCYGYYPDKELAHLNLMLTHSLDGVLIGLDELDRFLEDPKPDLARRPSSLVI